MESELNYLSEKIEELSQDRTYNETEFRKAKDPVTNSYHADKYNELDEEISILENILNHITQTLLNNINK